MSFPVNRYSKTVYKHKNVFWCIQAFLPQNPIFCDFYSIINYFSQNGKCRNSTATPALYHKWNTTSYTLRKSLFLYINFSIKKTIKLLHATSSTGYHPSRYCSVPYSNDDACLGQATGHYPVQPFPTERAMQNVWVYVSTLRHRRSASCTSGGNKEYKKDVRPLWRGGRPVH